MAALNSWESVNAGVGAFKQVEALQLWENACRECPLVGESLSVGECAERVSWFQRFQI